MVVGLAMLAVSGARPVAADIRSDQAAAIVEWPSVLFAEADFLPFDLEVVDTVIQLSNLSTDPVYAWCFYSNANAHCTNTGLVCVDGSDCCVGDFCGGCLPGWNETDFRIQLTPNQPLGWLASTGLSGFDPIRPLGITDFPIDGVVNFGPGMSSNAGSAIPPVPESPFNGSLRCIAVDEDNIPVDRNVLKGESTLEIFSNGVSDDFDEVQVAKHNAIGIQAIEGAVNDDNILVLGGEEPEYNGCPNFLILNHFFDFTENPAVPDDYDSGPYQICTSLTLVPCCVDYLRQIPGGAVVQYLTYNEFEQRFSTSQPFDCKFVRLLSNIDTPQNQRSIFSAGVAGTTTGQTRLNALGCGILGIATEWHDCDFPDSLDVPAEFNIHYQGDRDEADLIVLP
jgi:hypothetical protein